MQVPKPKRVKDEKAKKKIRNRPCVVCFSRNTDAAHILSVGAGGDDRPWNMMPLCRIHHTEQHTLGWYRFAKKYPHVEVELAYEGFIFVGTKLRRYRVSHD